MVCSLIALAPAAAAASTMASARSSEPPWFRPISAMAKTGAALPMRRPAISSRMGRFPFTRRAATCGTSSRRVMASASPSPRPVFPAAGTRMVNRPALRAPATSRTGSSPTNTVCAGRTPSAASAASKAARDGLPPGACSSAYSTASTLASRPRASTFARWVAGRPLVRIPSRHPSARICASTAAATDPSTSAGSCLRITSTSSGTRSAGSPWSAQSACSSWPAWPRRPARLSEARIHGAGRPKRCSSASATAAKPLCTNCSRSYSVSSRSKIAALIMKLSASRPAGSAGFVPSRVRVRGRSPAAARHRPRGARRGRPRGAGP